MTNRVPLVLKRRRVSTAVSRAITYSTDRSDAEVLLYRVRNKADRQIWVLTSTQEGAVEIAYWDSLIRDRANAQVQLWASDEPPSTLRKCWSAVGRAIKERRQGKIDPNGNFIVMSGSVISPMSSVQ